jgi:hypothetical protein
MIKKEGESKGQQKRRRRRTGNIKALRKGVVIAKHQKVK